MLDVLIIGAGPIGMACGIEATQKGLDYLIIEKGCLVNSVFHYPTNMTFFSTSDKIEIGRIPFVSHGPKPTRKEALEYYRRVKERWDLQVRTYEEVTDMERVNPLPGDHPAEKRLSEGRLEETGYYRVRTTKSEYMAKSVIVATGFYDHANMLNVPGEDLPKVKHFYDEPHPYIDQKILVIGAANSAIDVALETWRKGSEVTMVIRKGEIYPRAKYWVKPDIENRIKEGSIPTYFHSKVTEIREREVDIMTPEGPVTIENDFVLAMTGYHPHFEWLEKIGLELEPDEVRAPVRNPETFETNLPNVFLAGTVCGGNATNKWFIENSIEHASIIMDIITKR